MIGLAGAALLAIALLTSWAWSDRWPRRMLVTAYCPCTICCGPLAAGITASGKPVTANGGLFVAADPEVAFGTMLVIPGYNRGRPVPVYDRGGAIRGNRIDVYFDSHEVARRWGRRWLEVDATRQRPS
jgi:3D (Asp-Asp-Asp) domain-containing protein